MHTPLCTHFALQPGSLWSLQGKARTMGSPVLQYCTSCFFCSTAPLTLKCCLRVGTLLCSAVSSLLRSAVAAWRTACAPSSGGARKLSRYQENGGLAYRPFQTFVFTPPGSITQAYTGIAGHLELEQTDPLMCGQGHFILYMKTSLLLHHYERIVGGLNTEAECQEKRRLKIRTYLCRNGCKVHELAPVTLERLLSREHWKQGRMPTGNVLCGGYANLQ